MAWQRRRVAMLVPSPTPLPLPLRALTAVGGVVLLVAIGKLVKYARDVFSANIYEVGVIYDYEEDFDEDEHTHFGQAGTEVEHGEMVGPEGRDKELDVLRGFIRDRVVHLFKQQRDPEHGGNHFAVLILLDVPLASLSEKWPFSPLTSTGTPYVDSRYCTRPPRSLYGNYVVSRPQKHQVSNIFRRLLFYKVPEVYYEHAEMFLLDEFNSLFKVFDADGKSHARVVIMFSWLFPCDRCTGELVRRFGHKFRADYPAIQRVILVFAVFWRRMPFDMNWKNFERLRDNGFDVVRVKI